jgi:outer membrane receptor protein involved in Fe transport
MADGWYQFANLQAFADGKPQFVNFAASRLALPGVADPSFDRQYRYRQWFGFVQDSWRPTRRLTLNFGVRYEYPGAPVNTGDTRDAIVELGPGTFADRLTSAALVQQPSSSLYHADGNDWAARAGFALNVDSSGRTVLRGAFGIFMTVPSTISGR